MILDSAVIIKKQRKKPFFEIVSSKAFWHVACFLDAKIKSAICFALKSVANYLTFVASDLCATLSYWKLLKIGSRGIFELRV